MSRPARVEVAVGALVTRRVGGRDEVLLIERGQDPSKGLWTLPGGRVRPGETLAAAVARELHEETHVRPAGDPSRVDVIERIGSRTHYVIIDFRVPVDPSSRPVAGDDAAAAGWFGRDEVVGLATTRGLLAFLDVHAWGRGDAWLRRRHPR